ncbi:MAG TPA: TIGR03621 family F420-dependent LLM class oxidoreductase [Acidimicrobiia bacterium]|nr:TIGR03621 family F420-dependent LLM class oxidoreductase [Acidimicrobiia bacterium]
MAHDRKFRFGIQISKAGSSTEWAELARKAEDLGFSTLAMPDHFVNDEFAPMPAMMAAADATSTLRIGSLVFDNDYKHPVVLAKEAATLDVLSDGRLEFGLGAGWQRTDYDASGIPYDPPGVRIDRFEEGLRIVKGLWETGPFSHAGEHYTITNLEGFPKPVQQPRPPILIGGGGQRVLTIAAREADIIGLNANLRAGEVGIDAAKTATEQATLEKLDWIRAAAGDRFDDIEFNVLVFMATITEDRDSLIESMAPMFGITPAEAAAIPHVLVGTEGQIIDELHERREKFGVSYVTLQGDVMEAFAPIVAKLTGT